MCVIYDETDARLLRGRQSGKKCPSRQRLHGCIWQVLRLRGVFGSFANCDPTTDTPEKGLKLQREALRLRRTTDRCLTHIMDKKERPGNIMSGWVARGLKTPG